jgi:hypothetical protein
MLQTPPSDTTAGFMLIIMVPQLAVLQNMRSKLVFLHTELEGLGNRMKGIYYLL